MRRFVKPSGIFLILFTATVIMSVFAHFFPRFPGDPDFSQFIQSVNNGVLDTLMERISWIFDGWNAVIIVGISGLIIWRSIGWREAVTVLVAEAFMVISPLLKLIIERPRPSEEFVRVFSERTDYSFPSGHSFFTITIMGILSYLILKHVRNRVVKISMVVLSAILVLLVGYSRIYLGEHWISDVIGGYLAGGMSLSIVIWFYQKWHRKLHP